MKGNEIRAELVRNNIKVGSIAKAQGVSSSFISQIIYGVRKAPRIRKAIAEAINKPVSEVFPEKETA